jgi:glycosyltransferase involved in cell wall biosynthesis
MWDMDVGLFFYGWGAQDPLAVSGFSDGAGRRLATVGNVPTRMGEYLACGVPFVGNAGGGSSAEALAQEGLGLIIRQFDVESIRSAVSAAIDLISKADTRIRCVEAAKRYFSLESGLAVYERVYRDLEKATF